MTMRWQPPFMKPRNHLWGLELPHCKIHVCWIDACYFGRILKSWKKCSFCDAERYTRKTKTGVKIAKKLLIYFPIGPRLQKLDVTKKCGSAYRLELRTPTDWGLDGTSKWCMRHGSILIILFMSLHESLIMWDWGWKLMVSLHLITLDKVIHFVQSFSHLTIYLIGCIWKKTNSCSLSCSYWALKIQNVI